MTTLLDALKGTGTNQPAAPSAAAPQQGLDGATQTLAIQRLAAAKSGKAVAGSGSPQVSTVSEQLAAQAGRNAIAGVQQEGAVQKAEQEQAESAQKQQTELAGREMDSKALDASEGFARQSEAILRDYAQNRDKLDFSKKKARAEQLGFTLRLANDKYIADLQDRGRRSRLDNEMSFKEELTRSMFADELELFQSDLTFRSLLKADDREFQEQMGAMDLDFALSMASAKADEANAVAMWQGVGDLAQAGVSAYGSYKKGDFDTKKDPTTTTTDTNTGATFEETDTMPAHTTTVVTSPGAAGGH